MSELSGPPESIELLEPGRGDQTEGWRARMANEQTRWARQSSIEAERESKGERWGEGLGPPQASQGPRRGPNRCPPRYVMRVEGGEGRSVCWNLVPLGDRF